jgi:hypothetical protein
MKSVNVDLPAELRKKLIIVNADSPAENRRYVAFFTIPLLWYIYTSFTSYSHTMHHAQMAEKE